MIKPEPIEKAIGVQSSSLKGRDTQKPGPGLRIRKLVKYLADLCQGRAKHVAFSSATPSFNSRPVAEVKATGQSVNAVHASI